MRINNSGANNSESNPRINIASAPASTLAARSKRHGSWRSVSKTSACGMAAAGVAKRVISGSCGNGVNGGGMARQQHGISATARMARGSSSSGMALVSAKGGSIENASWRRNGISAPAPAWRHGAGSVSKRSNQWRNQRRKRVMARQRGGKMSAAAAAPAWRKMAAEKRHQRGSWHGVKT
jgi:hypothetical protein